MNKGVRGRLVEHCKYLIRTGRLQGFDANAIYEQTKDLPFNEVFTVSKNADEAELNAESDDHAN